MYTIHAGTAREICKEGTTTLLGITDVSDVSWAIGLAIERIGENLTTMQNVATSLRNGEQIFPFADGEDGARAADSLADNFLQGRQRLIDLHNLIIDCESILVVVPSGEEIL